MDLWDCGITSNFLEKVSHSAGQLGGVGKAGIQYALNMSFKKLQKVLTFPYSSEQKPSLPVW